MKVVAELLFDMEGAAAVTKRQSSLKQSEGLEESCNLTRSWSGQTAGASEWRPERQREAHPCI